jgi:hypothetical protein
MTQQYFTDGEWTTLLQAPLQVVLAVTLSDKTDPVSFLKETYAAIQLCVAEQQRTDLSNDLVKSLLASLQDADAQQSVQGEELVLKKEFELLGSVQALKDANTGRNQAIAHLQQVSSILATKVTAVQAQEFKNWLLALARKIAEAVKEDGLMGTNIGGERISSAERATLEKLEKALTLKV